MREFRVWVHVVENISKKLPGIEPREINNNELLIKKLSME